MPNEVTEEEYEKACLIKEEIQKTINEYHKQKADAFQKKIDSGYVWSKKELRYSRDKRCTCGHGLAYPLGCGMHHHWDCAGILLGIADNKVKHTGKLDFIFYDIKSENDEGSTRNSEPGN